MQQMRTATWPTKDGGSEIFEMVDGVARDIIEGKEAMKNDMDMGGAKVTNLGDAENDADSLPYGQAKEEFAPSGYGLGETNGRTCADANTAINIGFYIMSGSGTLNVPAGYEYGQLSVTIRNYDIYQFLIQNGIILFRQSADGGENWGEWSFVNPPMILGVEYRTTEMHNGKVVYAKYYDAGILQNNTLYSLPSGATDIVRMQAYTNRGHLLPVGQFIKDDTSSGYFAYAVTNAGANGVYGFTDTRTDGFGNGSYNMYIKLWYTKD